jgi:neutral ceramidase
MDCFLRFKTLRQAELFSSCVNKHITYRRKEHMNSRVRKYLLLMVVLAGPAFAAEGSLKVGAARVDITPPIAELPSPYKTIYDKLYVRALILDNGATRSAVVIADVPNIQAGIFADLSQRISQQARVPLDNILLGTTHTHNAMRVDADGLGLALPGSQKFADRVVAASLEAVRQAAANIKPARAGYGAGKAHLIAGRNEWYPAQHRYIEGIDRTGNEPLTRHLE